MTIQIAPHLVSLIYAHAVAELPDECCGMLVGSADGEQVLVHEVHKADNTWEGDRTHRFLLDPTAQLHLQRDCRERGLDIVGFYHSHPDGSAVPSTYDAEVAWPDVIYLIAAVSAGRPGDLRGWRMGEAGAFIEECVEVI